MTMCSPVPIPRDTTGAVQSQLTVLLVIAFDFSLQGGNVFLPVPFPTCAVLSVILGDPFRSPLADGSLSSGSVSSMQLAFVLDDTTGAVQSPPTVLSVIAFDFSLQGGNVFLPVPFPTCVVLSVIPGDPFRSPPWQPFFWFRFLHAARLCLGHYHRCGPIPVDRLVGDPFRSPLQDMATPFLRCPRAAQPIMPIVVAERRHWILLLELVQGGKRRVPSSHSMPNLLCRSPR
jgi:hypothetical protein